MITDLLRGALRFIAAVALFAVGAVAVTAVLNGGHAWHQAPKPVQSETSYQTYTAPDTIELPSPTRDDYTVVIPKPKPTPTVHKTQAAPVVRKPSVAAAKDYARNRLGSVQFACLSNIAVRESGWNTYATNRSSGAYGIPQALPGGKMASAGSDWRTNPVTQVKWMISYVNARYGSACGAWAYWQAHSNY